jgi:exopolyphosphatase / guanosine-5'-triphosphate,3'-diphosphate pyrophosphatase
LRRACIDIGSNTTRLLVADCAAGGLLECRQERAFTQIGRSLDAHDAIPAAKLAEVVTAVADQFAIARELGAEHVCCVATAGVRRASNGTALVGLIRDFCEGLEVEILTGAEEARLAFVGAAWGAGVGNDSGIGVVDAGGGSSEIVVGDGPDRVRWWISLPVGSGDVSERWLVEDPPSAAGLAAAREQLRATFEGLTPPDVQRLVAVGGSATSLRMLAGPLIDETGFDYLFGVVQQFSAVEFARRFGVDVRRARLLGGGLLILESVATLFGAPLEIGRGGLREGLLLTPVPR